VIEENSISISVSFFLFLKCYIYKLHMLSIIFCAFQKLYSLSKVIAFLTSQRSFSLSLSLSLSLLSFESCLLFLIILVIFGFWVLSSLTWFYVVFSFNLHYCIFVSFCFCWSFCGFGCWDFFIGGKSIMSFQFVNKGASIFNPFTSLKYITSFSFLFFIFSSLVSCS